MPGGGIGLGGSMVDGAVIVSVVGLVDPGVDSVADVMGVEGSSWMFGLNRKIGSAWFMSRLK